MKHLEKIFVLDMVNIGYLSRKELYLTVIIKIGRRVVSTSKNNQQQVKNLTYLCNIVDSVLSCLIIVLICLKIYFLFSINRLELLY